MSTLILAAVKPGLRRRRRAIVKAARPRYASVSPPPVANSSRHPWKGVRVASVRIASNAAFLRRTQLVRGQLYDRRFGALHYRSGSSPGRRLERVCSNSTRSCGASPCRDLLPRSGPQHRAEIAIHDPIEGASQTVAGLAPSSGLDLVLRKLGALVVRVRGAAQGRSRRGSGPRIAIYTTPSQLRHPHARGWPRLLEGSSTEPRDVQPRRSGGSANPPRGGDGETTRGMA
jgi:hypothetical protein